MLQTLGPVEPAVLVLHEVFETPYDEVAVVVGKTPAAVRQIAHRAREHVAERRPRMQVDRAQQEMTLERFMAAVTSGDVQGLVEVLAPEVVLIADGGGLVRAARGMLTQRDAGVMSSLPTIAVPTLVVVGADDAPFLAAADYMAGKIPGAKKVVIPDAGHAANMDQPAAFNAAVRGFLLEAGLDREP